MKRHGGASVVELMVVLCIMSILAAIAMPNFADFTDLMKLRHTVHAFSESLSQARLEALARSDTVLVAPVEGDWQKGWTIFIDRDGDRHPGPGDDTLARQPALPAGTRVAMAFSVPDRKGYIAYGPSGRSCRASAAELPRWGTVTIAAGAHKRRIILSFIGRHRTCNPAIDRDNCDGPDP